MNNQRMTSSTEERTVCQTCGHIIAKPRKGLSSVLYRQIVRGITTIDSFRNVKDKLIQIVQQGSSADGLRTFTQDLDEMIRGNIPIEEIKKWLLVQLAILGKDSGELPLYKFLSDIYSETGINEPFTVFYETYTYCIDGLMTKNFVSRALGAIGLKAKMVRIDFEGHKKSAMVLKASKEELCQLLQNFVNTSS
jgi:hypothetical protein